MISIHALLAESDAVTRVARTPTTVISIHALLAESDLIYGFCEGASLLFLSTLSLRRATVHYDNYNLHCVISIHALLAESDDTWQRGSRVTYVISIHALLAESDVEKVPADVYYQAFLSTLSLRRATDCGQYYIRAREISIHALLAESDRTL